MAIYEFYCPDCHRRFQFLARSPGIRRRPDCPRCGRPRIERQLSMFAVTGRSRGAEEQEGTSPDPGEARMERALSELASEASRLPEDDPRAAAGLMKRFSAMTGVSMGAPMEQALRRLESGEDPEAIEEDMGALMDEEAGEDAIPSAHPASRPVGVRRSTPLLDPRLYDL